MNLALETLKRRDVQEVWAVYCSHFEPDYLATQRDFCLEQIDAVFDKCLPAKITPFLKTPFTFGFQKYLDAGNRTDIIMRRDSSYDETTLFLKDTVYSENYAKILKRLYNRGEHIECHVHHEFANKTIRYKPNHTEHQKTFHNYVCEHDNYDADAERLENIVQMFWEYYEKHTGAKKHPWFFCHGCWALNASCPEICRLTNEIQILMRNGCIGAWDFPAGRQWCDPQIHKEPFTCNPIDAPRSYDLPESDPQPIRTHGIPDGRFFVWNHSQRPKVYNSSLDYYQAIGLDKWRKLSTSDRIAGWIANDLVVIDGVLLIKLHGHCLNKVYLKDLDNPEPPLWKALSGWLGDLVGQCEKASIAWHWLTVREIMGKLKGLCPVVP